MLDIVSRRSELQINEHRAVTVLAEYLLASPRFGCPGMDGASVADVVASAYPAASAAGWVPHPTAVADRHPELAAALTSFLGPVVPSAGG
jgi:hypothetical protein